jgi:hypothetical protein
LRRWIRVKFGNLVRPLILSVATYERVPSLPKGMKRVVACPTIPEAKILENRKDLRPIHIRSHN